MKMKKFICCLLVMILLVGLIPSAIAAETATVSISSGEVKAGEAVTLTVSIQDNPGIAAFMVYVYYDTSVFDVDLSTGLSASGNFRLEGGLIGNSIAVARQNGRYAGDVSKDGVLALWYNASGLNTTSNGSMLTIKLMAKETAANGNYTVSVGYSEDDTRDQKGESVKLDTVEGTVTLTGGVENTAPGENPSGGTTGNASDGGAVEKPENTVPVFPDAQGHWAQEYIEKAAQLGLILGNEHGMYMPDKTMSRAECVTILWRACGSPKATKTAGFTDLDPNQKWYHEAVAWSAENGVIKGTGDGTTFSPNDNVNRDQLATILFRMAGGKSGMESMLSGIYDGAFSDSGAIADWAKQGVYWSIYNNILCGENSDNLGTQLKPGVPAKRAQIAVMIVRYLELD